MIPLYMHAFSPDAVRFARLAARERLLPKGEDPGYAWHAILAASFGSLAPKPFVWLPPRSGRGGQHGRLLAYSSHSLDMLRQAASTFADPTFSDVLALDAAASKEMPTKFTEGASFGFRVRVRPVVRTGAPREGGSGRERDAFDPALHADRKSAYTTWVASRLRDHGATVEQVGFDALRLTAVLSKNRSGGASKLAETLGPDAVIVGRLRVSDPGAFAEVLTRGLGRFRAFGFGMILLSPG